MPEPFKGRGKVTGKDTIKDIWQGMRIVQGMQGMHKVQGMQIMQGMQGMQGMPIAQVKVLLGHGVVWMEDNKI